MLGSIVGLEQWDGILMEIVESTKWLCIFKYRFYFYCNRQPIWENHVGESLSGKIKNGVKSLTEKLEILWM